MITSTNHDLELVLQCNPDGQTICQHQYTSYPLRLSIPFRLEGVNSRRAYYYLVNTSPGLLAGDKLTSNLQLASNTQMYLTDQAATKVHPMPKANSKAILHSQIRIDANASLELVPEPVILYTNAILEQKTAIALHPTARLFISEIIIPGRLAKLEFYQFNYYFNRLEITDLEDNLLFVDASCLSGKENKFKGDRLFATMPILGNAIAILPDADLQLLSKKLTNIGSDSSRDLKIATTILPSNNGVLIRALSNKTSVLKQYFTDALNCMRSLTNSSPLPYIPK